MEKSELLISDAEYKRWPVLFSICKDHQSLFADYEYASLGDSEYCILCNPVENDSLGG
jgi:hypothetical protein